MNKYIIKNCPSYMHSGTCKESIIYNCYELNNCLLKQIIERASKFRSAYANEILDLLEIEEE